MPKFCANCGTTITIAQRFCTECGTPNANYNGTVVQPTQTRTAILKELEDATLQKVDELRVLREYQQRVHNIPVSIEPETLQKPLAGSTTTYFDQENIRLQKLEMLVKMEEEKLNAVRKKAGKETVVNNEALPLLQEEITAAPFTVPAAVPKIEELLVVANTVEEQKITETAAIIETIVPPVEKVEKPLEERHTVTAQQPIIKTTNVPITAIKENPKPISQAVRNIEQQKAVKRNLAIAAVALIVMGGVAASVFAYPKHEDVSMVSAKVTPTVVQTAPSNPLVPTTSHTETTTTEQEAAKPIEPIGKSNNDWDNLKELSITVAQDIQMPKYTSIAWLVSMNKKLSAVNLGMLSKDAAGKNEHSDIINPISQVNDSVQWSLLKYCMEHPAQLVHQANYYALAYQGNTIDINSMYAGIVNPKLKVQAETFYKQAVIRHIRAKEQPVVVQ